MTQRTALAVAVAGSGRFRRDMEARLRSAVGGQARLRVIVLLASVLGLNSADTASVGAVATELERSLHIGNTQVGLLVTVSTGIGALATLPVGALTDRVNRTRLLSFSIFAWSVAMIASGAATSFTMLLVTRVALGAVVATAGPAVASLIGDLFPAAERGRIYGFILAGELLGTGLGFLVPGDVAGLLSWRYAFWVLAVPGFVLAVAIRRLLPEPSRGGQSQLAPGATELRPAVRVGADEPSVSQRRDIDSSSVPRRAEVEREIEDQGIAPHDRLVLHTDPTGMSLWRAVRYVLSVRTNVVLTVSSALGYFFLTGIQTFAVVFLRGRFGLGQSVASTLLVILGGGSLVGVLVTGRIADRLIHRRHLTGRVVVGATCFIASALLFLPTLLTTSLLVAAPLFFLAAAALGGTNPPLNAARLDIMHSRLWGRAESVRTALASAFIAGAPLLFGYVSTKFKGQTSALGRPIGPAQRGSLGLDRTFLVMLIALAAAGAIMFWGRRTYPRDVATAMASEDATRGLR